MDISREIHTLDIVLGRLSRAVLHTHEDRHEFFFCAEGRGIQHLEGRQLPMKPGDFFLFPAGQLHIGSGTKADSCRGYVLNISDALMTRLAGGDIEFGALFSKLKERSLAGSVRISLGPDGKRGVGELFEAIIEENRLRRPGYQIALRACIQKLAVELLRNSKVKIEVGGKRGRNPRDRIEDLCRFIESNYMSDINVDQAARMTNLSRSHFHAIFAREKGCPFIKHLNSLRAGKAADMLKKTDMSLEDVASACGFKSLSHFYLVFRREIGEKPGSLVRRHGK